MNLNLLFQCFFFQFKGVALKCFTCESVSNPRCIDLSDKTYQPQECVAESFVSQTSGFFSQLGGNSNNNKEPVTPTCLKIVTRNGKRKFVVLIER